MANITFVLRNPKSTSNTLVFMIYRLPDRQRLKYSTKKSVHPDHWNSKTYRANTDIEGGRLLKSQLKTLNIVIDKYENTLQGIIANLEIGSIQITPERLRQELDKVFGVGKKNKRNDFIKFCEDWIETVKFTRERNPKPIEETTRTKYRVLLTHLKSFIEKERSGSFNIDAESEVISFYEDFVSYLQNDKNQKVNTIGKNVKALKVLMRVAYEAGVIKTQMHESSKFIAPSEETTVIYLTSQELEKIWSLDLSEKKSLDRVKDVFLMACYTGLSYADSATITYENNILETEDGKQMVYKRFKTRKRTSKFIHVPLHWRILEILEKYNGALPKVITNQKLNDYIKDVCELAGIDTPTLYESTAEGMKVSTYVPKYQLISSKVARKTFATNAVIWGIPRSKIMLLTGHATESAFNHYIGLDGQENAKDLMNYDYFKRPQIALKVV